MSDDIFKKVCDELEFETGAGWYPLTGSVSQPLLNQAPWTEQARKLGAEAIFFVKDHPTVLFFKLDLDIDADTEAVENDIRQLHLKTWNTSHVPLFFVALPAEVRVYSAYQKPVRDTEEWKATDRWLKRIKSVTKIAELQEFSRSQIESGNLFHQRSGDFDRENRVDQCLLRNLRLLRKELEGPGGKNREQAHALIGRSVFIRYLEDRKVLVEDYFTDKTISRDGTYRCYADVLNSKADTYHLFHKLNDDFNGDLFPLSHKEEKVIHISHLRSLRDFLLGESMGDQAYLFFWAYKFDIIPVELISTIYEEFYHEHGGKDDRGTHYTPTPLVDFVLSQALTSERLNADAHLLDASCGSGIFLVEAFKRMVYHECHTRGKSRLSRQVLTKLLTERIAGIDVNESAIQVAAFSLYLAFLDFLEPKDIRRHKQLPRLICHPEESESSCVLFHANAFCLTVAERAELKASLKKNRRYKGRSNDVIMSNSPVLPLENRQFDVIVGNPPWGSARGSDEQLGLRWCQAFLCPVGDKEISQCFMWRLRRLLKPGGEIGLLVSTGVLFKHQEKSKAFRHQWLKQNRIRAVHNFAHVRHIFFRKQKKDAVAPFAAVFFSPALTGEVLDNRISYVSVKQDAFIEQTQAVVINKTDFHKVRQSRFLANDWLWKTYMWGSLRDAELIEELKSCHPPLQETVSDCGMGYQESGVPIAKSTRDLGVDFELHTDMFHRNAEFSNLVIPLKHRRIHRLRNVEVYKGPRLLVKRGISRADKKFGEIQARLAYEPFAFRNSIIGFRLDKLGKAEHKVLLGIMLSSLTKYYHFLTCSIWGFWHYEIHVEEHLNLPVRFPKNRSLKTRIIKAVEQMTTKSDTPTLFDPDSPDWQTMQGELDEAIFDLYELSREQRDLVGDLCQVTLEFFYNGTGSQAARPPDMKCLKNYRDAFLEIWHERLAPKGKELEARIYAPLHGLLCGISCELKELGTAVSHKPVRKQSEWRRWFKRLNKILRKEYSEGIYIDRVVKMLDDSSMFVVKRAERRFWTKSQARQDAHELLTEVFKLEWRNRG
ncbi:N-6 DNA methylase [Desulfobacterales bacterium HSG2]|nr:N-6 DNA methylase [Desulfobacterales bacterium HSG2]